MRIIIATLEKSLEYSHDLMEELCHVFDLLLRVVFLALWISLEENVTYVASMNLAKLLMHETLDSG